MSSVNFDKFLNDHECFLNFKKGNEPALARLYKHFHKPLLFHGLRIVRDQFEVNSIIQEAFLKAWQFRERLTSLPHIYRFMRLNVTWRCYDYYRHPDNKRYRQFILTDRVDLFGYTYSMQDMADVEQSTVLNEERIHAIYKAIPYLPANRQTILTLYFKYGLSFKQIAKRFSTSNQAINLELQKGLEHLKKVIHANKRLDVGIPYTTAKNCVLYVEVLNGDLLELFKLRYEMKLGFDTIAARMNLPQSYVQQQYIAAHLKLRQLTNKDK